MKRCYHCGQWKDETQFYRKGVYLQSWCISCCREHGRRRNGTTGVYRPKADETGQYQLFNLNGNKTMAPYYAYIHDDRVIFNSNMARYLVQNKFNYLMDGHDGCLWLAENYKEGTGIYKIFNRSYGGTYVCSINNAVLAQSIKRYFELGNGRRKLSITFGQDEPFLAIMEVVKEPIKSPTHAQTTKLSKPLSIYTPRELMQELFKRGYRGVLTYTKEIDITKL